jgi:hypothetical protein
MERYELDPGMTIAYFNERTPPPPSVLRKREHFKMMVGIHISNAKKHRLLKNGGDFPIPKLIPTEETMKAYEEASENELNESNEVDKDE